MDVSRTLARETEVNLFEIDEITLTLDINELCVLNLGGELSKELRTPHSNLRVKIRVIGVTRERSSRRDGGAL
jgi:hypothetical protein